MNTSLNLGQTKRGSLLPEIKSPPNKRDLMLGAVGDDQGHDDLRSELDSEAAAFANSDVDRDFAYLRYHLSNKQGKEWKTLVDEANGAPKVLIQGKLDRDSVSKITLKCEVEIDHVPKNIVLKAISDMNIRSKWDNSLGKLEVLEFDKRNDVFFVKADLSVPQHMQQRDAVLVRKIMKDFPENNKTTIVQRSVEHALCPTDPSKRVRADLEMNGMIIEDDKSLRGTKISWILASDLNGCLPTSLLVREHVNYQRKFI